MQKVLLAWAAVFLLLVTGPAVTRAETAVCGRGSPDLEPPAYGWVCGQIIVGLRADSDARIEDVVARQGGDADDVLDRLTDIDAYVIAVEAGAEPDAAAKYAQDPDVRYAELNLVGGELGLVPNQVVDGLRARILRLLASKPQTKEGPSCHMLTPVSPREAGRS